MEVLEFIKQKDRMCDYYSGRTCTHDDSGETCPAMSIDCEVTSDELEQLVAIVEKWAKEHPEETEAAATPKNNEPCVKTIQDDLEGAIYREIASNKTKIEKLEYDVYVVRHTLAALHDKIFALSAKIDHTPTMESGQTPEQKRTNKDTLMVAFPRMVLDGDVPALCPRMMDRDIHIQHCAIRSCDQCRREYWLAEVRKDENRE